MMLWLQRQGRSLTDLLGRLPGWTFAAALLAIVAALAWLAVRQVGWLEPSDHTEQPTDEDEDREPEPEQEHAQPAR